MDHDDDGVIMLEPLRHIGEPPAPGYDIGTAMASGRRIQRRRRITGAVAVVAAVAAAVAVPVALHSSTTSAPRPTPAHLKEGALDIVSCHASVLSVPAAALPAPGYEAAVESVVMDPTGHYIAGRIAVSSRDWYKIVLWHDGVATVLPIPHKYVYVDGVNASGTVLGEIDSSPGHSLTGIWEYRDGHVTTVHATGPQLLPTGINARGDIAGVTNYSGEGDSWPGVIRAGTTTLTVLRVHHQDPNNTSGTGSVAIGDDGTVVADVGSLPYVWPAGAQGHMLPVLPHMPKPFTVTPVAVRGTWAVGVGNAGPPENDVVSGWIWNLKTGTYSRFPGNWTDLEGVNASGEAVGSYTPGSFNVPIVVRNGRVSQLPMGTIVHNSVDPKAISDDGRTIVGSFDPDDFLRPWAGIEWRC